MASSERIMQKFNFDQTFLHNLTQIVLSLFLGIAGLTAPASQAQSLTPSVPSQDVTSALPKRMALDADPSFDVATIRPNNSGAPMMQGINEKGRYFTTHNTSLGDLIQFAYDMQAKQIVGGSEWMDKDRYDINAVPNQEGIPNLKQVRIMVQKLLTDRFKLTFHPDKRELSAFVLTAGKNEPKLNPTQLHGAVPVNSLLPGVSGWTLAMRNATTTDLTGYLQMIVLDRPVVDQTDIRGKFDFNITFTPDDSQFKGHPPPAPKQAENGNVAPGLFEAIQQQLGLKLETKKALVNTIVIDHVEKPSEN